MNNQLLPHKSISVPKANIATLIASIHSRSSNHILHFYVVFFKDAKIRYSTIKSSRLKIIS